MKQMDEGTYIVDPRELDHEPVMLGNPRNHPFCTTETPRISRNRWNQLPPKVEVRMRLKEGEYVSEVPGPDITSLMGRL